MAAVGTQIGELSPLIGEDVRDIRLNVREAAQKMGLRARTWVDGGKVYFYILRDNLNLL